MLGKTEGRRRRGRQRMRWLDGITDSMETYSRVAHQAPLSTKFCRQEYWSGSPFPSPGHLLGPGIEPVSFALAGGFFTIEPPGKPLTNLDSILKSRDNTLLAKVRIAKPMVFPVVMYRYESWTIKKAEC